MESPVPPPGPAPARRRRVRWLAWTAVVAAGLALVAYGGISLVSAEILTRSHQPSSLASVDIDPTDVSPDATPWVVRTEDGLTLRGWYHPTPGRRRLVVLAHGLRASWVELAGLGRDLHRRGYDVLLFDFRGHGRSDPARVTMGRRERGDLRAALRWARAQGYTSDRIGWVGFSMGASTLLMEGADNADFRAAVVDSPFGDLPEVLDAQLALHSNLPRLFNPGILAAARFAFGVRTDDLVPIRSARKWAGRPLLLIHGTDDSTVPVAQAHRIARSAGSSCRAVVLPGVEHVRAYASDPRAYVDAVDAFFRRNLGPGQALGLGPAGAGAGAGGAGPR